MKLYLIGHEYRYAIEQIMMVLFPGEKPEYPEDESREGNLCRSELSFREGMACATAFLTVDGKSASGEASCAAPDGADQLVTDRILQRILKQAFYKAAVVLLGEQPPWGALTGIRPAKLMSKALEAGESEDRKSVV